MLRLPHVHSSGTALHSLFLSCCLPLKKKKKNKIKNKLFCFLVFSTEVLLKKQFCSADSGSAACHLALVCFVGNAVRLKKKKYLLQPYLEAKHFFLHHNLFPLISSNFDVIISCTEGELLDGKKQQCCLLLCSTVAMRSLVRVVLELMRPLSPATFPLLPYCYFCVTHELHFPLVNS